MPSLSPPFHPLSLYSRLLLKLLRTMSTTPSLSGVDLLPPSSRGRGHSRSRGWTPSPVLSTDQSVSRQQSPAPSLYTNGHRLSTPFHDNIRPRSRSPLPLEHGDSPSLGVEENNLKIPQGIEEPSLPLETSLDPVDSLFFRKWVVKLEI